MPSPTDVPPQLIRPKRGDKPVYYHEYLGLDQILTAQHLKSIELSGQAAHDEHLFIIIHQVIELGFVSFMPTHLICFSNLPTRHMNYGLNKSFLS